MAIRAIIFDFGNVIGFFNHRLTTERLAPHTPLAADELHARLFGGPLEKDYDSGRITTDEFLRLARESCRLRCPDAALASAWADIFGNPETIALLPQLKRQCRLILGSNTNELHSQQFQRQFAAPLRYFDHVVLSHQIKHCKPVSAFFAHCQRFADCGPQECLFVDDLPANIAGAREFGWQAILYTGIEDLQRQFADRNIICTEPHD